MLEITELPVLGRPQFFVHDGPIETCLCGMFFERADAELFVRAKNIHELQRKNPRVDIVWEEVKTQIIGPRYFPDGLRECPLRDVQDDPVPIIVDGECG